MVCTLYYVYLFSKLGVDSDRPIVYNFQVKDLIENALSKRTKFADLKGTYRGWDAGDESKKEEPNKEGNVNVGLPSIHEGKKFNIYHYYHFSQINELK